MCIYCMYIFENNVLKLAVAYKTLKYLKFQQYFSDKNIMQYSFFLNQIIA